jgi:hypothetical protein
MGLDTLGYRPWNISYRLLIEPFLAPAPKQIAIQNKVFNTRGSPIVFGLQDLSAAHFYLIAGGRGSVGVSWPLM